MCGRCGSGNASEACWYCDGALCLTCWIDFGHCGHPEADQTNQEIRDKLNVVEPG